MNKKNVLVMVLAMLLVAMISVGGTIAWLSAETNQVKNTFTVGDVTLDDPNTPSVQDGLTEADVNEYGEPLKDDKTTKADGSTVTREEADRVTSNEYKLMPGHTYVKDPTVTVAKGSEPTWVRMFVKITDMKDIKAVFGEGFLPQDFVNGTWNNSVWMQQGIVATGDDYTVYEFWYKEAVDARNATVELPPLFTEIAIPDTVTNDQVKQLQGMEIHVVAQAMQQDGFENDQAGAWAVAPEVVIDGTSVQ